MEEGRSSTPLFTEGLREVFLVIIMTYSLTQTPIPILETQRAETPKKQNLTMERRQNPNSHTTVSAP